MNRRSRRRLRAVSLAMIFASLSGLIACSAMNAHPIDYIVMCIIMIFGFLLYPSRHMFDSEENWPVRRSSRDAEDGEEQDYEAKRAEIRERAAEMRKSESEKKEDNEYDAKSTED